MEALLAVGSMRAPIWRMPAEVPVREWAPDAATARGACDEIVRPGDCVLVKGSRVVGLELVAEALQKARR